MDRVDIGDRVRAAAMDAGILPNDAMGPVIEALADIPEEMGRRIAPLLAELARARSVPPPVLTDKQVDDIGARLAHGCQTWSGGLVRAANRQHYAILLAALLVAALAGAAASWVAFGTPIHPSCAVTEAGGRLCGVWVVPDKAK